MREAIQNRVSRRTFTKEAISGSLLSDITTKINEINTASGLNLTFVEDGSAAFSSVKTTYGMFKNVHSLILMKGKSNLSDLKERVGYFGEKLMLDLVDMGLGTCWVGGTFDRESFTIPEDEEIICVMLAGLFDKPNLKDRIMISQAHNKRKPISERLTATEPIPDWLRNGMEAVIYAPSAINKQKPHFTYQNGLLTASVPDDYRMDLVDLGIAKKHFELGAGGHFVFGNGASWSMEG